MFYTTNEVRRSLWMMTSHLQIISKLQGMLACLLSATIWLAGGKTLAGIVPSLTGTKVCPFHHWAKQHLTKWKRSSSLKKAGAVLVFISFQLLWALGDDRQIDGSGQGVGYGVCFHFQHVLLRKAEKVSPLPFGPQFRTIERFYLFIYFTSWMFTKTSTSGHYIHCLLLL